MGSLETAAQGGADQLPGEQTHGPWLPRLRRLLFAHLSLHICGLSRQDGGECPDAGSAALLCPVLMEQQTTYT